jgi:MoxR-like ATPase
MAKAQAEKEKEREDDDSLIRNPNEIRDLIFTSLSLAESTHLPFLFLGNPGIAKTTGVRIWAEMHGYKVTTLIGTQRVAEEILGYMVNDTGERRLITYTPDWFDEIMENEKDGFKTLLFIDELSQAPDNVQGAMLQLIFDRKVGGRDNYLPDNCLVVSAANYKGNIPPQCGLQAPTLNRFVIINIQPQDGIGLINEFLQSESERKADLPVFQKIPISERIEKSVRDLLKEHFNLLFQTYSRKEEKPALDIMNTEFSDIFDRPGPIYNFITGRTVHYLNRLALGMIHLGIVRKAHKEKIGSMCLGLVGLGTNSFKNEGELRDFQLSLKTGFQKVIRRAVEDNMKEINSVPIDFKGKTIEKAISDWMLYNEANGMINDINLHRLMDLIKKDYNSSVTGMNSVLQKWQKSPKASTEILGDLQKIDTLHNFLKENEILEIKSIIKDLSIISAAYRAYKTIIMNGLV